MSSFYRRAVFFQRIMQSRRKLTDTMIPKRLEIISVFRQLLLFAGISTLIVVMSPLAGEAADIDREDGGEETCELNEASATRTGNKTSVCSITRNEQTLRSTIPPDQVTANYSPAERSLAGEVYLRAETARTMVPAPVLINNYRIALEEYLALVNTLLPGPRLPQLFQPHAKSLLVQTDTVAGRLPSVVLTTLTEEEKPHFNSHHIQQRVVGRTQTLSVLYLDHEVPKKHQRRIAT